MLFRLDCGILGSRPYHVLRASILRLGAVSSIRKGRAHSERRGATTSDKLRTCEAPSPRGAATKHMPPPGPPLQPPYALFHRTLRSPCQDAALPGLLERPRRTRRILVG